MSGRPNAESKYVDVVADYLAASSDVRMQEAEQKFEDVVENRREVTSASARGLNPWKPGVSPNPGGRPKTKLISAAARRVLAQHDPNDPAARTFAEQIVMGLVREAVAGDVSAAKELREITEGKLPNKVEVGEPGDFTDLDSIWEDASEEELDDIIAEHLERTLARRSSIDDRSGCSEAGIDGRSEEEAPVSTSS